jgi:hypothetical protein
VYVLSVVHTVHINTLSPAPVYGDMQALVPTGVPVLDLLPRLNASKTLHAALLSNTTAAQLAHVIRQKLLVSAVIESRPSRK